MVKLITPESPSLVMRWVLEKNPIDTNDKTHKALIDDIIIMSNNRKDMANISLNLKKWQLKDVPAWVFFACNCSGLKNLSFPKNGVLGSEKESIRTLINKSGNERLDDAREFWFLTFCLSYIPLLILASPIIFAAVPITPIIAMLIGGIIMANIISTVWLVNQEITYRAKYTKEEIKHWSVIPKEKIVCVDLKVAKNVELNTFNPQKSDALQSAE